MCVMWPLQWILIPNIQCKSSPFCANKAKVVNQLRWNFSSKRGEKVSSGYQSTYQSDELLPISDSWNFWSSEADKECGQRRQNRDFFKAEFTVYSTLLAKAIEHFFHPSYLVVHSCTASYKKDEEHSSRFAIPTMFNLPCSQLEIH